MLNEKEFLRLISNSIRKRRLAGKISSEKLSELSGMDYSSVLTVGKSKAKSALLLAVQTAFRFGH